MRAIGYRGKAMRRVRKLARRVVQENREQRGRWYKEIVNRVEVPD